jgi:hypothetical protein
MPVHEAEVAPLGHPPVVAAEHAARIAHEVDHASLRQVTEQEQAARGLLVGIEQVRLARGLGHGPREGLGHLGEMTPVGVVGARKAGGQPAAHVRLPAARPAELDPVEALGLEAAADLVPEGALAHQ